MFLIILRIVFLVVAAGAGASFVNSTVATGLPSWALWWIFIGVLVLAGAVIAADMFLPSKRIDVISSVFFGLIVGLLLTYVAGIAFQPLAQSLNVSEQAGGFVRILIAVILCYMCISLLAQTKDDFRFIIPYVEFAKEVKTLKPYILDTSIIIDGRIADVVDAGVLDSQLIMPRFVLGELQGIADSSDRLRRGRGRRGLDILNRLRSNDRVDFKIFDRDMPEMAGQPVDMKLVLLAKHLGGKVVTGDYNLNKVARLHNVDVINLNDVANALKPVFLPGEGLEVLVIKPGEQEGQGVGYLDDGTMVVIEGGRESVGETVHVTVTSVHQTSAGRMLFGRYDATMVKK